MNNNQKESKNKIILNFLNKHRLGTTIILIVLAVILILLPQLICWLPWVEEEQTGLVVVANAAQIVSSVFVIIGTIIAVWQYYLSSSQKISEFNFSRVEKAIELSNYYKDNILSRYSFVKGVFDNCGITGMIAPKRKTIELKEFDIIELNEIYTEEEIKKFEELHTNKDFIKTIISMNELYDMGLNGCVEVANNGSNGNGKVVMAQPDKVVRDFFKTYITQTLNNAEYFAMAFTHNTADESVIFQSIYPSYLEMCFVMYYYIARNSDPSVTKLYTNIAELYCIWRKKEQKQKDDIKRQTRKVGKEIGTIVSAQK